MNYNSGDGRAKIFFATVQNKLLHAVTSHTAAELILSRADAAAPNMGLTTWKGSRVRKGDVVTAKNYLGREELDELNRLVELFLNTAELRARNRQAMTMADWENEVDRLVSFAEKPLLRGSGVVSHAKAEKVAHARFDAFDEARRQAEAEAAETEHEAELDQLIEQAARQKIKKCQRS